MLVVPSNQDMIKLREYQPGDAKGICDLLNNNTDYLRDYDFWLWSNRIWPASSSIIVVALHDDEVVGHYAILPQDLRIGERVVKAGLGVHAFIAPDYRKRVPIFQISKKCYHIAKSRGMELVYGFPNENYRLIQEKVEGWKCVNLFNAYTKKLVDDVTERFLYKELDYTDSDDCVELNNLIERDQEMQLFGVSPTLKKWINRYANHPQNKYVTLLISQAGVHVAVVVVKEFLDQALGKNVGHLIDYVKPDCIPYDLLNRALEQYFAKRVSELRYWPINSELRNSIVERGYADDGFSTFFGIKILDEKLLDQEAELCDISNWNLPMGISDAF